MEVIRVENERVASTAERLREAIKDAGKKQIDLVRATGIDKGSLNHYVHGRYEPKSNAINKLARALNVSEMWLWGYNVPKERNGEQKKNDKIVHIISMLRRDEDFYNLVDKLSKLDKAQYDSIGQLLAAFDRK